MTSIFDLIIPFIMALIMSLSGYMVALIGDWIKKIIIVPILIMLIFDGIIIYMFLKIGTTKLQLMMGIMLGTILKIITFILYQKYLSDE
tara:strand:- start:433 stop:699 length:267 start_codon:yes stop_codon:yes gene_type:complete